MLSTDAKLKSAGPRFKKFLANGFQIGEGDFIAIFSTLIIQLGLTAEGIRKKHIFLPLSKSHVYSFRVDQAISAMEGLCLKIDLSIVNNTVTFSFGPDLALSLLKKFFAGHLLHDPSARTEIVLCAQSTVQITPKGTALVYDYCKSVGMRRQDMPDVVKSELNTMKLFRFDRSCLTRRALYSKYLNHILISEMLGPQPNIWSPETKPKNTPNLFKNDKAEYVLGTTHTAFSGLKVELHDESNAEETTSPIYHRYFSNPESDSHIQYYESFSGMRLFRDKLFQIDKNEVYVEYCFSGKTFVQWLCDCTTLYCASEAVEFGQLMLQYGLIIPVSTPESSVSFLNLRDTIYTWNKLRDYLCRWSSSNDPARNARSSAINQYGAAESVDEKTQKLVFQQLLADPGIRHLFKTHLEKEKCSENINAFLQLKEFQVAKRKLTSLMNYYHKTANTLKKARLLEAAEKMASKNLTMASYLCSRYFGVDSSCNLNIASSLQQEIDRVITLIKGGSCDDVPLTDEDFAAYLKTPIMQEDTAFELASDAGRGPGYTEDSSLTSKEKAGFLSEHDAIEGTLRMLDHIDRVFGKIAHSVYRMMEVDSYPKFIQSKEYQLAVETLTHRS